MKKVFAIVAVVALVAGFTSCSKECNCKTTYEGLTVEETINLEDAEYSAYKNCKDLNKAMQDLAALEDDLTIKCK